MCGDSPPPAYKGPGDAHSNREWVWQRERYLALFDEAPEHTVCGEATPFYLYHRDARRRIAVDNPDAKLIAVLRDPVDRAYSNWMHLWMDGLEPCPDVVEAVRLEQVRIDAGWAPFWHYRGMGMYGRQVADLLEHFPREQLLLLRYADLVADPVATLATVSTFLGVGPAELRDVPRDNARVFVPEGPRTRALSSVIRTGAHVGQFFPPHVWRRMSRPLLAALHRGGTSARPRLTPEQRHELLEPHREDIALLEEVSGQSYRDWLGYRDGGTFDTRRSGQGLTALR
jgi:hypothetical protein